MIKSLYRINQDYVKRKLTEIDSLLGKLLTSGRTTNEQLFTLNDIQKKIRSII